MIIKQLLTLNQMKILLTFITSLIFVSVSYSQGELKQDSAGVIAFHYNENGNQKSIIFFTTKFQNLLDYKVEGDEVLFFLISRSYLGWKRYLIDKTDGSCVMIDSQSITRKDKKLRDKLSIRIDNINKFNILEAKAKDLLISIDYSSNNKAYTLNNIYNNTKEVLP